MNEGTSFVSGVNRHPRPNVAIAELPSTRAEIILVRCSLLRRFISEAIMLERVMLVKNKTNKTQHYL